jgi:UDP-N-acetylmuramoylalanine--D-glutamate ligase
VDSVIVYGAVGEALNEAFLTLGTHCIYYPQLEDAIRASIRLSEGQNEVNIVFSPGFASFDQFDSFSDRGNFFQKTIFSLLKG